MLIILILSMGVCDRTVKKHRGVTSWAFLLAGEERARVDAVGLPAKRFLLLLALK